MDIIGSGMDAMEIQRIAESIEHYGDRFLHHVFTAGEIAYCRRHKEPARHFAARFAAKEAGMKALGTGWSNGVGWQNFEVRLDPRGRPHLHVTGRAAEIAATLGATHALITLAHDGGLATAVVAIEGDGAAPHAEGHGFASGRTTIGEPAPPPLLDAEQGEVT
jgi:holo-[acyl-carrier protein] synthase